MFRALVQLISSINSHSHANSDTALSYTQPPCLAAIETYQAFGFRSCETELPCMVCAHWRRSVVGGICVYCVVSCVSTIMPLLSQLKDGRFMKMWLWRQGSLTAKHINAMAALTMSTITLPCRSISLSPFHQLSLHLIY